MARERHFDIVIAGGGMVGTCLALALAPLNLRVAVVEAVQPGAATQPSFDDRSTALSRSSQLFFEALGLWPRIESTATPIRKIHVSDRGRFGFAHIDAEEQGVEALGYIVINRILGGVLQAALADTGNVKVLCPARISDVQTTADHARAIVSEADGAEQILTCGLLVAADGANSNVRDMLGISASKQSYGQQAVIGNVLPEKPIDYVAYERFTKSGPLALLPIADQRAAFVWGLDLREAERAMALDDANFLAELQAAFGYRLGEFSRMGKRVAYPLALSKAMRLTAQRAVLVGNAAHGLHPVAAQGFNLGLRDVAALSDCIFDALTTGPGQPDIGSVALLQRYSDWRRGDQQKLVRVTDGLVKLFANEQPLLSLVRNIGMLGFDLVPGVRRQFARHTMGLAGRLPRLSRGVPLT